MAEKKMNTGSDKKGAKNAGLIALAILAGLIVWASLSSNSTSLKTIPFSEVITKANNGEISSIIVSEDEIQITEKGKDKPTLSSRRDSQASLQEQGLDTKDISVEYKKKSDAGATWLYVGSWFVPIILFGLFILWMTRQAQGQVTRQ